MTEDHEAYRAQLTPREVSIYEQATKEAQQAWDDGGPFYLPTFLELPGAKGDRPEAEGDGPSPLLFFRRRTEEVALAAITTVGWRLHTWRTGSVKALGQNLDTAEPIFTRG